VLLVTAALLISYLVQPRTSNMSDQVEEFAQAGSGASQFYPVQCSSLRKGGYVLIKGFPCKVVDMSTSKTGKHGHAKVNLTAIDIFTGKKHEDMCPSTHNVDVPNVTRKDYTLCDIDDGFVHLMSPDGSVTKNDLKMPEGELGEQLRAAFKDGKSDITVSVLSALDQEAIIAFKESGAK